MTISDMSKIVKAVPLLSGYLQIVMQDGRFGEFDVKPFMNSDFFAALKDENYFQQARLFFAGVGWSDGQDLGPDTVAAGLKV